MMPTRRHPVAFALAILVTLAGGASSLLPAPPTAGQETPKKPPVTDFDAAWKEVEQRVSEDQLEAAARRVAAIREAARAAGDAPELTRALVREVQLRTGLHGYETAVRFLRDEPWPTAAPSRTVLELFYAQSLLYYAQAYSWEVSQRERVDTGGEVDLKRWTRAEIYDEAERAYLRLWQDRDDWGAEPLGEIAEYLRQNNYPPRIRGTLRDAVSYLWAELLADTGFWRPEQEEGVYRLDLGLLADGDAASFASVELGASATHPLLQAAAILADLEAWHAAHGRAEAAFEARRARLDQLYGSFTRDDDRDRLGTSLERRLAALGRRYEWWSLGMATRAEWVRRTDAPDARVRARRLALEGREAHPGSVGGERCRALVAEIEAPGYDLEAMAVDGPARRSIRVRHRNFSTLHFRAFAVDLFAQIDAVRDYELLPGYREVPEILAGRRPDLEWTVDLPPTPDYRDHYTFVTPPMTRPGLWVVIASPQRDFGTVDNQLRSLDLFVGDLLLLSRSEGRRVEVEARSGRSGLPLADVAVYLYRYDWQKGHRRVAVTRTDVDGLAHFDLDRDRRWGAFLAARLGDQVALDASTLYAQDPGAPGESSSALVFTDRSVYRPSQDLLWKVVAYRGGGEHSRFETVPEAGLTVELRDANGEVVTSEEVATNAFGTVSGRFAIPAGRLLGAWTLSTSWGGAQQVRVEEYKRPTFEVTLAEPEEALRLNREATISGEARYYFGLPVPAGAVTWRVTREPVYPWWCWWGRGRRTSETVAAGDARLGEDGRFSVRFVPPGDEREAADGVTYRFRVAAEVTDEGGETRDAARSFRLGFVAVDAQIALDSGFVAARRPFSVAVRRQDLDGSPRPGRGRWRLLRLEPPARTLLPADEPHPIEPSEVGAYRTPGDALRARWDTGYDPVRALRGWADGERLAAGEIDHGEDGEATLDLPALPAGAYRLRYETEDAFGARFETQAELLVAGKTGEAPALPLVLAPLSDAVKVGDTARLLVASGLPAQEMVLELYRFNRRVERRVLRSADGAQIVEIPIGEGHRGGFGVTLTALRDHQLLRLSRRVFVPWDDRELRVELSSFRDTLRPGSHETWTVKVETPDGSPVGAGAAEILAYMYDRSLDLFAPHSPPRVAGLYPDLTGVGWVTSPLGTAPQPWTGWYGFGQVPAAPSLHGDVLLFESGYAIGGLGRREMRMMKSLEADAFAVPAAAPVPEPAIDEPAVGMASLADAALAEEIPKPKRAGEAAEAEPAADEPLRSHFAETAFFEPHLLTGEDGAVRFELDVPDSVTEWNVWVHAVTRDLRGGSLERRTRTVKELLVRPYLPRFLREGDRAELAVVVNNAGAKPLAGRLRFDAVDPASGESRLGELGLRPEDVAGLTFEVAPGGGTTLTIPVQAPSRVGELQIEVRATAGDLGDGERRLLPLLPGRLRLAQSRFAALQGVAERTLRFDDLLDAAQDPTLRQDQLVVTVDAQLFYGVLQALPYLVEYPYECVEQTLNRFVSTGIVSSVFDRYPAVAKMAKQMAAERTTRLETWNAGDPNRKIALVETPWLAESRGGDPEVGPLLAVLDPQIAAAQRASALAELRKAQTSLGAFPWWPGGPPSPYMTLYVVYGLSKAIEHGVPVPQDLVQRAWSYLHQHYVDDVVRTAIAVDCCWEMVTFLNYALSAYPEPEWTGGVFTDAERKTMLDFSFRHWRRHSPLSKAQLALTLERSGRHDDAMLVFDSIMDSAKTDPDLGTYWAPEDRAWLWYNDTVEGHAFALRALTELRPDDPRRSGLVQWLFLEKKLSHWKSTRATAEAIYALVHHLEKEGALGVREAVAIDVGPELHRELVFAPDVYSGKNNQIVVPGPEVAPAMGRITVSKATPGFLFASATWHFSTEKLPEEASGDLFHVTRSYFRRVHDGREWTLQPLARDTVLEPGDQLEVQLSIRARHAAEYVHLQDPRGAGFEPQSLASGYKWDLGLGFYEEIRDTGTNFFFEQLPAGEYTLKYRLRANMKGTFRVGPATLQSMYAPEFTAYSAGNVLAVRGDGGR